MRVVRLPHLKGPRGAVRVTSLHAVWEPWLDSSGSLRWRRAMSRRGWVGVEAPVGGGELAGPARVERAGVESPLIGGGQFIVAADDLGAVPGHLETSLGSGPKKLENHRS